MYRRLITILSLIFALSTNALIAEDNATTTTTEATEVEATAETASDTAVEEADALATFTKDRVLGDENAPITLIEYASFTCPHCDNFHTTVFPKLKENFIDTGKVKLIYREVYFDGAGMLAGSLARCVPEDQYFPMVSAIYETDENWLRSQESVEGVVQELTKLGVMAGLSKDAIIACLDNRPAQEAMYANSQELMKADDVKGTPSFYANGQKVESWAWEDFEPFLNKMLEE